MDLKGYTVDIRTHRDLYEYKHVQVVLINIYTHIYTGVKKATYYHVNSIAIVVESHM